MRANKIFIDEKPVTGRKEDFDLAKLQAVYQDLTDYLQMPIDEISRNYWQLRQTQDKAQQKSIEKAATEKEVLEYYRTTGQYLYELSLWEAQKDKQREFKKLYLLCRRFNIKKILDFGGGVGGLSIYLNNRGLKCDYLDIPGQTYNFAQWRFKKHKIELKVINSFDNNLNLHYDAVVAYDVFEHMFDLPRTMKKINRCLVVGGYLLSISTFSGGGLHLLKNETYRNFAYLNAFLSQLGFEFAGQLKADRLSNLLNKMGWRYLTFSSRLSKRPKHGGNLIVHKKITNAT